MPATESPLVTILVPSFNEDPATIRESFQAIRQQTWENFECLVIDESSDPIRAEGIRAECHLDSRFKYLRPDTRLGLAGSLNHGLTQSKGLFIARCDSDDICLPNRIALQVEYLLGHPGIGILGGAIEIIDETGVHLGQRSYPLDHDSISSAMMLINALAHPTVMFRRELPEIHGGYDPAFRYSEDLELWLRWLNAGVKFANLPQIILKYRQQFTSRNQLHWAFNRQARLRHFSRQHLVLRTVGLVGIAIWSKIPKQLQERLFRALIFKRT